MILSHIEIALPQNKLSIKALHNDFQDFNLAASRSGVDSKYIAADNETALDLAEKAFQSIENKNSGALDAIDGLIFVTQTPDFFLPSNSFLLMERLKLEQDILNYDINQGCAAFGYASNFAKALIDSKQCQKIAIVFSDTYSKIISPEDRGTSLLFGDGCAVCIMTNEDKGGFKLSSPKMKQMSQFWDLFAVEKGAFKDKFHSQAPSIKMQGAALLSVLTTHAPEFIDSYLQEQKISIDQIDMIVCHQASKIALDVIQQLLNVPDEKMFSNLQHYGNTTCASIPIALKEAIFDIGPQKPKRILVFGFGVGFAMSVTLLEYI